MNTSLLLSVLIFSIVAILSATRGIMAVDYTVNNTAAKTAGGGRFDREIGKIYTRDTMDASTKFIWKLFQQTSAADRKSTVKKVGLFIDDMKGVAYTSGDQIHVSARYINSYTGNVKTEFTGVLYHEMTHVWQWNGNGRAPGGLIEGIADYVRLKAGYAPGHWVKPGEGDKWDHGYDVTARFLDYCNGLRKDFVAELNKKMRIGYSDRYFADLLGPKTVDQLWKDYKAKYGHA
ncbi:hypothetical protein OROMI_028136 [Orobanche minor]